MINYSLFKFHQNISALYVRAVLYNMESFKQLGPQRDISIVCHRSGRPMCADLYRRAVWQSHSVRAVLLVPLGVNYKNTERHQRR